MKKLKVVIIATTVLIVTIFACYKAIENYRYPIKYKEIVEKHAAEAQLPESLIFAVISIESGFDPNAKSEIDARGLMQITKDTFEWIKLRKNDDTTNFDDLYDPEINIKYGSWILEILYDEFGTVENTICAYYAGWGTATSWLASKEHAPDGINITNIPYKDTIHHLNKFNNTFKKYKKILDEGDI